MTLLISKYQDASPTIGVSKRSCRVCGELLRLLSAEDKPFLYHRNHDTITACTLPECLPTRIHIHQQMTQTFGSLLTTHLREIAKQMPSEDADRGPDSDGASSPSGDDVDILMEDVFDVCLE